MVRGKSSLGISCPPLLWKTVLSAGEGRGAHAEPSKVSPAAALGALSVLEKMLGAAPCRDWAGERQEEGEPCREGRNELGEELQPRW